MVKECSLSTDTMVRCPSPRKTMLETNELLRGRIASLENEWHEAEVVNDTDAMDVLESQIQDAHGMIYTGLGED